MKQVEYGTTLYKQLDKIIKDGQLLMRIDLDNIQTKTIFKIITLTDKKAVTFTIYMELGVIISYKIE